MGVLQELMIPLARVGGKSIAWKGPKGLEELEKRISSFVRGEGDDIAKSIILVNSRHKSLIDSALRHIDEASSTLEEGLPADLISIDILDSWHDLGEITGETADEDIVDRIFEKFCLGK